ncbi:hypothetical protein SHIRM173S_05849 [Streptomyces hirsutus]
MAYVRKDAGTLTAVERLRFVKALLEVKRRGESDEFVRMHLASTPPTASADCAPRTWRPPSCPGTAGSCSTWRTPCAGWTRR